MLKRSFQRSVPYLVISWVFMLRALTTSNSAWFFISSSEYILPILLVPICSFILYDKSEIELALVHGTKTSKLFFSKLIPAAVYTLIPCIVFTLLFKSHTDGEIDPGLVTLKSLPEYIPENYKVLLVISIAVTLIFFFAVYSFVRVLSRNCYLPILVCFGLGCGFTSFSATIVALRCELKLCIVDPLIDMYFIGNTVPNKYAEKYPELSLITNAWTWNRLIIIVLSAVIYFATYLMLRREKLHQGFGE